MSLQTYIDNEVPAFAEWDSISEAGNSTVDQVAGAGFPERGTYGLRVTIDGTSSAYAEKDYGEAIPAGGDFYFGFWLNVRALPSATKAIFEVDDAGVAIAEIFLTSGGVMALTMTDDGGLDTTATTTIVEGRWYYVQGRVTRAATDVSADGTAEFLLDNMSVGTLAAKDNFNTFENNVGIQVGFPSTGTDGAVVDYDEIKTGTTYQQAFSPEPATDLPETRRTLLLAGPSADAVAFADYFIQQTGIPRSNVVILPNASTDELLASKAAWDTQVETDLDAWVALATVAFAKITTIIVGYEAPGYFTDGGVNYSATSRMNHFGTAFSAATANPLYAPTTVERLAVAALNSAGVYLASRIDADSLANAKAMLDAGLAADLLTTLRETDILYSDDSALLADVDTQHLRLETSLVT